MLVNEAVRAVLPKPAYTLLLMVAALLWLGYMANDVVADVKRHYMETSKLVRINRATCQAVHTLAKLDPASCWKDGSDGL